MTKVRVQYPGAVPHPAVRVLISFGDYSIIIESEWSFVLWAGAPLRFLSTGHLSRRLRLS